MKQLREVITFCRDQTSLLSVSFFLSQRHTQTCTNTVLKNAYIKFALFLLWSHHVEYNTAHIKPKLSYLNRTQTQAVLKANKPIYVCLTVRCVRMSVNISYCQWGGCRHISFLFSDHHIL
jgi:hypothetical protein